MCCKDLLSNGLKKKVMLHVPVSKLFFFYLFVAVDKKEWICQIIPFSKKKEITIFAWYLGFED